MEPTKEEVSNLLELAVTTGITKKSSEHQYTPIKLAYYPFRSRGQVYRLIESITKVWQKLVFKASSDDNLFEKLFQVMCCDDPLNCGVLRIRNIKPKLQLNSQAWYNFPRCDFMLDREGNPKLIEYNLSSVSMSAHSQHYQEISRLVHTQHRGKYIENKPNQQLVDSIRKLYDDEGLKGIFLFIVQANEVNIIEQRFIEVGLLRQGIKSKRIVLIEAASQLTKDQDNNLRLGGEQIAIAYFRSGYRMADYKEDWDAIWKVRELIELSNAIKIPTVSMELFNCKRVQTELSKKKIYSKYLTEEEGELLERSVAKQWEFDEMNEEEFQKIFKQVEKDKHGYVLKPNCEGGGNNIFNEQVHEALLSMTLEERQKHILMEKIDTQSYDNVLISGSSLEKVKCDYEISHYGVVYGKNQELITNKSAGFLIRVKPSASNEGGIMSGVGSICSWVVEDN